MDKQKIKSEGLDSYAGWTKEQILEALEQAGIKAWDVRHALAVRFGDSHPVVGRYERKVLGTLAEYEKLVEGF